VSRLTRGAVLAEARALGDTRGFDAVTIRGVADRLGVTPMALYRHVGDKDGLLDGLADTLYAELRIPDPADGWWEGLAGLGSALAAALRTAGFSAGEAAELHDQLSNMVFALVRPELHGRRNRAAFERGLELLRDGLAARLSRQ